MKTFKGYKTKRPFHRPDRYDPRKDYAIAIGAGAVLLIGWLAVLFLLSFAR